MIIRFSTLNFHVLVSRITMFKQKMPWPDWEDYYNINVDISLKIRTTKWYCIIMINDRVWLWLFMISLIFEGKYACGLTLLVNVGCVMFRLRLCSEAPVPADCWLVPSWSHTVLPVLPLSLTSLSQPLSAWWTHLPTSPDWEQQQEKLFLTNETRRPDIS